MNKHIQDKIKEFENYNCISVNKVKELLEETYAKGKEDGVRGFARFITNFKYDPKGPAFTVWIAHHAAENYLKEINNERN